MERVRIDNLVCGYGKKVIVKDINMQLNDGEVCCVIGPNGCGKSTFLKTIGYQIPSLAGEVYIEGRSGYREAELARILALLLTERVNVEYMTGWDIVAMGRYPYTGRFAALAKSDYEIVEKVLYELHIEELSKQYFNQMSDGQKQRILIGRALAQDTPLLIMDEPTTYLDVRHKYELMELLRGYAENNNKIIIMTLHELELVRIAADKVLALKAGSIFDYGLSDDVLKKDNIVRLFNLEGIAAYI